jgi:putative salt-induced outer membrane protein YdiY
MNYVTRTLCNFIVITTVLLTNHAANAGLLVMKNSDRITGEIKRIWDAEVTIEPEYSDEFQVDVSAIDHIESSRDLEIELKDGKAVVARFTGLDENGKQTVTADDQSFSISLEQIFELDEPEEDFEWDSNVELSVDFNDGNTESHSTKLRADTTFKIRDHRHIGEITFLQEAISGNQTQDQELLLYNYNWLFRDPWFFSTRLGFERDPIIQLENRMILSLGVGRDIWQTPRRSMNVQLGAGALSETIGSVDPTAPSDKTESAVLTWALRYRQDFIGDDLELYHNHSITSNISGRTNTSYKTTTGLRFEITDLLYANLSVDYDYETHPAATAVSEDIRMLIGFGAEF